MNHMKWSKDSANNQIYAEKISSNKTELLFLALMVLCALFLIWRVNVRAWDVLGIVFGCLSTLFLFYSLNYRTLIITLTSDALKLTFGIFSWTVPLDNVSSISLDDIPTINRLGGAGIHFMMVRNRYRASFNFLEYPRLVIAFKKKVGLVRDISFSTRQPDYLMQLVKNAAFINQ
jgi:Ca2+/Na+ antiporter